MAGYSRLTTLSSLTTGFGSSGGDSSRQSVWLISRPITALSNAYRHWFPDF